MLSYLGGMETISTLDGMEQVCECVCLVGLGGWGTVSIPVSCLALNSHDASKKMDEIGIAFGAYF